MEAFFERCEQLIINLDEPLQLNEKRVDFKSKSPTQRIIQIEKEQGAFSFNANIITEGQRIVNCSLTVGKYNSARTKCYKWTKKELAYLTSKHFNTEGRERDYVAYEF